MPASAPQEDNRPWGGVAALLTGSLVTLIGVLNGVEPATILLRAFAAGVLLGGLASVASSIVRRTPRPS